MFLNLAKLSILKYLGDKLSAWATNYRHEKNRIVHAYFEVDLDIVWQVITQDLGLLLIEVEKAIKDLET